MNQWKDVTHLIHVDEHFVNAHGICFSRQSAFHNRICLMWFAEVRPVSGDVVDRDLAFDVVVSDNEHQSTLSSCRIRAGSFMQFDTINVFVAFDGRRNEYLIDPNSIKLVHIRARK